MEESFLNSIVDDEEVRKYTVRPLSRYEDEFFDLRLATLKYEGVEIDLSGSDSCYLRTSKGCVKQGIDLGEGKVQSFKVFDSIVVRVQVIIVGTLQCDVLGRYI